MKTDTATVSGDIFCSDGESTKPNGIVTSYVCIEEQSSDADFTNR